MWIYHEPGSLLVFWFRPYSARTRLSRTSCLWWGTFGVLCVWNRMLFWTMWVSLFDSVSDSFCAVISQGCPQWFKVLCVKCGLICDFSIGQRSMCCPQKPLLKVSACRAVSYLVFQPSEWISLTDRWQHFTHSAFKWVSVFVFDCTFGELYVQRVACCGDIDVLANRWRTCHH